MWKTLDSLVVCVRAGELWVVVVVALDPPVVAEAMAAMIDETSAPLSGIITAAIRRPEVA